MTFSILDHLEKLEPAGDRNRYNCPVCGGNNLTVEPKTGKYQCWSGCKCEDIREAIAPLPRKVADTKQERTWQYVDESGDERIQVVRRDDGTGKKRIWQRYWNRGGWQDASRVPEDAKAAARAAVLPYRYKEAIASGNEIFFVEGEKTADALWRVGIPAVTTIGGCDGVARYGDYRGLFKGKQLILAPDLDKPGLKYMEAIAALFPGQCDRWCFAFPDDVRWRHLPTKDGVDLADWIARGAAKPEIMGAIAPATKLAERTATTSTPAKEAAKEKPKKIKLPAESTIAWDLEKKLKDKIIWSEQHDSWFMYEADAPGAWAPVKDGAIRQLIVQHVKDLVGDDLYDGCSSRYIAGICSLLKDDTLRVADFNLAIAKKKHLIGFRNGVYNLQDQIFVAGHDPQNYLLSTLPRDYAPLARQWDEIFEWLNWVFDGNREYIDTFNCVAAAIMRRMSSLQVFPHFKGIGGGGKSVALKLLATLVGDKNTVSSSLEDIAINRFETARLVGKLLCLMPDQDNWHGSIGNFLKLTGRDLVRIERKNKDGGEFLFEGFVAISSNPDVFTSRTGRELTRRQLLLPFTKDVSTPDPYFADRLASGMHGWTNYLLSLSEEFIVKTLQGDRRRAINPDQWESKKRSDSIAAWLDECCAVNPSYSHKIGSNKSDLSSLFGSYQTYCINTGSIPKGLREFSDLVITTLRQAFPDRAFEKKRTSSGFIITGISLRADHTGDPYITDMLPKAIATGDDFVAEYARWLDTAPPEADITEPLEPIEIEPIEIEQTEPEKVCAEAIAAPPPESAPAPKKQKAIAPTPKQDQPKPQPTEITEFGGLRVGDAVILDLSELDKKAQKEMRAAISLPPDGTEGVISSFKENSFKKGVFSPRVKFPDREDPILVVDFVLKLIPKDTPSSDFVR